MDLGVEDRLAPVPAAAPPAAQEAPATRVCGGAFADVTVVRATVAQVADALRYQTDLGVAMDGEPDAILRALGINLPLLTGNVRCLVDVQDHATVKTLLPLFPSANAVRSLALPADVLPKNDVPNTTA
jgi:hypothetical protein